ncbi:SIS domain-containing protein [Nonomuraea soli]|uniref:Glutamine--fructose-6-phosphate aminotransferase [isomerizing] n=1 Tax=Nonomuraea soli TaxID=1032476 RepID=A0A7W0CS42_9ACTN|nr:SIS domain-containing protein [Nonomuraea soli]MBA2896193.1 glucosamine--fructose-6-phosphate aminotransferase (isomerizing) [Nonomuraea soli]
MTSRITFREGQARQGAALRDIAERVRALLDGPGAALVRGARKPLFTGIGASHAALAVPVELLRSHGIAAQRVLAPEIGPGGAGFDCDLVIGVSQSGRSSETVEAFRRLDGIARVAVLNVTGSPLAELAEATVDLGDRPDSYASTIGYTGTIVALDLLATAIAGSIAGSIAGGDPWDGIEAAVGRTREQAASVLAPVVARAAGCVAADAVGAGPSRASAEEAALLLREVARMPAAASVTRNYLHGEMESAGHTLHLVLGDGREVELAASLAGAGHLTVLVTSRAVRQAENLAVVRLTPETPAERVVLETVVIQELVAALADERGIPIESFVFANDDTKEGGVDPADFAIASPELPR